MKNKKLKKKLTLASLIISSTLSLCACKSNSPSLYAGDASYKTGVNYSETPMYVNTAAVEESYDYYADYVDESEYYYDELGDAGFGTTNLSTPIDENQAKASVAQNRKLIKNVDMTIETVSFDETIAALQAKINSVGGYIENEYTYNGSIYNNNKQNKYANITVRVPDTSLDSFVNDVSGIGNVTQKTTSTRDVTLSYVDTESKKEMYLAEQERFMALLEKAETIEEITYLTKELTQIRYNIESMESSLRVYDDLVDYATINFNINEVQVLTPAVIVEKTPGEELKEGFKTSVSNVLVGTRDFFIRLIINLPYIIRTLICMAIPVLIVFVIVKITIASVRKKKKNKENSAKKENETQNKKIESDKESDKAKESDNSNK